MNFEAMLLSQINDVEIEPEIIKIAEDLKNFKYLLVQK